VIRRREFITLLGGAAAAWPSLVQSQPTDRPRRVGVLQAQPESDADFRSWRCGCALGSGRQLTSQYLKRLIGCNLLSKPPGHKFLNIIRLA
jgi:hypothetical protein